MHSEIKLYFRGNGSAEILPIAGTDGENSIYKIISICNTNPSGKGMNGNVFYENGIAPTISTNKGEGNKIGIDIIGRINSSQDGLVHSINAISQCQSAGHGNCAKVAIPVLAPERENKRQNGRRFKENGDPMFTLTAQDRHGVAIEILGCLKTVRSEYGKNIRKDYESGKLKISRHKFLNYSIRTDGCCNTIDTVQKDNYIAVKVKKKKPKGKEFRELREKIKSISRYDKGFTDGIYVEMPGGFLTYCVWYEKYQCYIAIRKLTPKECFRLQGWSDDYFEKAAFVNSDSQLYKQAGNGVTVDVVREIGRKIKMFEEKRKMVSE